MGDFKPHDELKARMPHPIKLGIENHRLVDKETDRFQAVKDLKRVFSPERRRFAGVVTDIAFDYFLIKHWEKFAVVEFTPFIDGCYQGLGECREWMPERMLFITAKMQEYDWLRTYATLDGIEKTIDQVSKRIRFKNNMAGSIVEVTDNYAQIEAVFLELFEHLVQRVDEAQIEQK